MNPSTKSLLQGASRTVGDAQAGIGDLQVKLNTIGALARLLNHGTDAAFHLEHYAKGQAVLRQGLQVLGKEVPTAAQNVKATVDALVPALSADWSADLFEKHHDALQAALTRITSELLANGVHSRGQSDFFAKTAVWENQYYTHVVEDVPVRSADGTAMRLDAEAIQACLRRRLPNEGPIEVTKARALSGGYGRATVLIELAQPVFGTRELVLRAELPISILTLDGIDITTEFHIIKLAFAAGIPAPEPLLLEEDKKNETGLRFILVRKLPGKNVGSAYGVSQTLSPQLLKNLMAGLNDVHHIDLQKHAAIVAKTHLQSWLADSTVSMSVLRWMVMWEKYFLSSGLESPLLTRAYAWLKANVPEVNDRPSLLHSDYGFGNLLFDDDRVSAVLDWEATHLGDPAEEVGWIIYTLRGHVSEDELLRIYEAEGGKPIEPFRLRYFDVFTVVKLACCGIGALMKFRNNATADPTFCLLASISIAPFMKQIEECIDRAEAAKLPGQKRQVSA